MRLVCPSTASSLLIAGLLGTPSAVAAPGPEKSSFESGVRLVVHRLPGAPTVALRALWPGGTASESAAERGLHLGLRGSRCLGFRAEPSAYSFAWAGDRRRSDWRQALRELQRCVRGDEAIVVARGVRARVSAVRDDVFARAFGQDAANGQSALSGLRPPPRYRWSGMTLVVVGDIDLQSVAGELRRLRAPAKEAVPPLAGKGLRAVPGMRFIPSRRLAVHARGFRTSISADSERAVMPLLGEILRRHSWPTELELAPSEALLGVAFSAHPRKLEGRVRELRELLQALRDGHVHDSEIEDAKRSFFARSEASMMRPVAAARFLGQLALAGNWEPRHRWYKRVREVSPQELRQIAPRVLAASAAISTTMAPISYSPSARRRVEGVKKRRSRRR